MPAKRVSMFISSRPWRTSREEFLPWSRQALLSHRHAAGSRIPQKSQKSCPNLPVSRCLCVRFLCVLCALCDRKFSMPRRGFQWFQCFSPSRVRNPFGSKGNPRTPRTASLFWNLNPAAPPCRDESGSEVSLNHYVRVFPKMCLDKNRNSISVFYKRLLPAVSGRVKPACLLPRARQSTATGAKPGNSASACPKTFQCSRRGFQWFSMSNPSRPWRTSREVFSHGRDKWGPPRNLFRGAEALPSPTDTRLEAASPKNPDNPVNPVLNSLCLGASV
jgi:hypothetical protein